MPVRLQNGLWLPSRTSDPGSPSDGDIWLRSDRGTLMKQVGGSTLETIPAATWPSIASGYWHCTDMGAVTSTVAVLNRQYFIPFMVPRVTTLVGCAIEVTTGTGSATQRGGFYPADPSTLQPGAVSQDWGTISGTSTATVQFTISSPPTCLPGFVYFVSVATQGAAAPLRARSSINPLIAQPGGSNPVMSGAYTAAYQAAVSGAFSGTPTLSGYVNGPSLMLKFS